MLKKNFSRFDSWGPVQDEEKGFGFAAAKGFLTTKAGSQPFSKGEGRAP
ncbi:MAG: hypothetical protein ACTHNG_09735 [Ginsengibacter sp.]